MLVYPWEAPSAIAGHADRTSARGGCAWETAVQPEPTTMLLDGNNRVNDKKMIKTPALTAKYTWESTMDLPQRGMTELGVDFSKPQLLL